MAAVLIDAIATWRRFCRPRDRPAQKRRDEVVSWFEDADAAWPFSFVRICAELELDAARIRSTLLGTRAGDTHQQAGVLPLRRVLN